jgi:predicted P-loop ATPase
MTRANGHTIDWQASLIVGKQGGAKPILANAITALRVAPQWSKILYFDVFKQQVMLRGDPPWSNSILDRPWTDEDDLRATEWMQHNGIIVPKNITGEAIETVARESPFHPPRDYLQRCRWDGEDRLTSWLSTYLGCDNTEIIQAFGRTWMISAVARIMEPGCKADCALILEGPQGKKKSTALKTLFYPWFSDEIADLGTKDASLQVAGIWCIEIAELDAMGRSEVAKTKAFMSRATDRFRPPYGKRLVEIGRGCVFAGTVNHNEYLRDETGGRRFLPAATGDINIDALGNDRDSLWAEARDAYLRDEKWWLEDQALIAAAVVEQNARRIIDPWQREVDRITNSFSSTTASEVLIELGLPIKDQQQLHWNRAAACLKALGWRSKSIRYNGRPCYRYVPPT